MSCVNSVSSSIITSFRPGLLRVVHRKREYRTKKKKKKMSFSQQPSIPRLRRIFSPFIFNLISSRKPRRSSYPENSSPRFVTVYYAVSFSFAARSSFTFFFVSCYASSLLGSPFTAHVDFMRAPHFSLMMVPLERSQKKNLFPNG